MAGVGHETLKQLMEAHFAALVLYARQWCDAPEDIVQDVFLLLMREAEPPCNPPGWLFAAVRHKAMNASRARRRRAQHETGAAHRGEPWLVSKADDVLDATAAAEALQELPLEQRETIIARLWGGLTLEETARLVGVSPSMAYRRYQQGIAALRERLEGKCHETQDKTRAATTSLPG